MPLKRLDDPDLSLADLITTWPELRQVFFRHDMQCVGCLIAPLETVKDACAAYDLNVDAFYKELAAMLIVQPLFPTE